MDSECAIDQAISWVIYQIIQKNFFPSVTLQAINVRFLGRAFAWMKQANCCPSIVCHFSIYISLNFALILIMETNNTFKYARQTIFYKQ